VKKKVKPERRQQQRIIVLTVIGLAFLGVLVVALDWHEVRRLAGEADWKLVLLALLPCVLSYFCLSYSFAVVNRLFGVRRGLFYLFNIGYVSTALNNILAFLGAAGHSLRLMLMQQPGTATGQVLAASIFHSYLNNLVMFCLLPISLIYLVTSHSVHGAVTIGIVLVTGVLVFFLILAAIIFFAQSIRAVILQTFNRIWHFFVRRDITHFLSTFDSSLTFGMTAIRDQHLALVLSVGLLAVDWALALVVLWFCFDALGNALNPGTLLAGFAIGISAGNLSMVPGGLGIQEASMTGIYALLGVSFEQAVLASILFRIVYDFVPFLVSLAFYRRLLRVVSQPSISVPIDKDKDTPQLPFSKEENVGATKR
jgi:uncharacterized protein (TIRG00374 family)